MRVAYSRSIPARTKSQLRSNWPPKLLLLLAQLCIEYEY